VRLLNVVLVPSSNRKRNMTKYYSASQKWGQRNSRLWAGLASYIVMTTYIQWLWELYLLISRWNLSDSSGVMKHCSIFGKSPPAEINSLVGRFHVAKVASLYESRPSHETKVAHVLQITPSVDLRRIGRFARGCDYRSVYVSENIFI